MRAGFCTRWVTTLGIVVALLSPPTHAQEATPPPLPPLPGMPPPPPQKAEIPKLPQLKTIPEIPPAKQVAAKDAPAEQGWIDKAKGLWERFKDKPKEVAKKDVPQPKKTESGLNLLPPPPMQPPVIEGTATAKIDPDIFAFDEDEKKNHNKEEVTVVEVVKPPVLPSQAVAKPKQNVAQETTDIVLPNPVKKKPAEPKKEIPDLAAISFPDLDKTIVAGEEKPTISKTEVSVPALPEITLPKIEAPKPEKQIATMQKPVVPVLPAIAPTPPIAALKIEAPKPEKQIATMQKPVVPALPAIAPPPPIAATKIEAPKPEKQIATMQKPDVSGLTPIAPPPSSVATPRYAPKVPEQKQTAAASTKNKVDEQEPKGWLDALTEKALEIKDNAQSKIASATESEPNKDLFEKLTAKPAGTEKPKPAEKEVVIAEKPKAPIVLPPVPTAPSMKKMEVAQPAPPLPTIPSLPKPEIKQEIAAVPPPLPTAPTIEKMEVAQPAPPLPTIPSLPKPEIKQEIAAVPPPLPTVPEISVKSDPVKIPKTPALTPQPKTPTPLPALALGDLKLPNDANVPLEKQKEEVEKIDLPLKPKSEEPKEIVTAEDMTDADTFEFGALNNKGQKEKKNEETAAIIADIDTDDPAFKFWKGHNFKTQVLPDVLNRKEYESRNQHLPKAVYREDLEQLLFVAIARGDLNAIRAMLNNGVDVETKNAIGDTPLVHAAINGQAGAVRVLLARGANPNNPNVHGNTAMQVAAERGREDIIDALFEMGAKATADYRDPLTPLRSGVGRGFASVYGAMLDGENPKKKQMDERNRALQALADAGPNPRTVISQGMPGLSQQIIDDQSRKMPGEPLTFDELERKLAYQEYVRKTGDDPIANRPAESTLPKLISPAGVKASPVPIPYTTPLALQPQPTPPPSGYTPPQVREPIVGLPPQAR